MTVRIKCNTVWAAARLGRAVVSGGGEVGMPVEELRRERRRRGGRSVGEEGATSIPGVHSFASFFNPHTFSFGVT